ncbi:hypothetical protein [Aliarcobacter butzleri]|uniref:hypothetical protein n=1 Tax=Aliarcobacter butzleri TaxID=28197 RepID=UPI003AF9EB06
MTSPIQPDKTYGVLHTESFFSFLGFAKKIGSSETQKVDIYLDDKLIDTIEANKFIEKIDDMYDVENQAFSYNLPTEYIGKKATISFKNHDSQDELLNSPYTLIDKNHEKFNEAKFLHSLNEPLSEELRNMYKPNCVGFLAIKENLEDEEFVGYIKELKERFPDVEFKGFCFDKINEDIFKNIFPKSKINYVMIESLTTIFKNIEIYVCNASAKEELTKYYKFQNAIRIASNNLMISYYDKTKNILIQDLKNSINFQEHSYVKYFDFFGYKKEDINDANKNIYSLIWNTILNQLKVNININELTGNELMCDKHIEFGLKYPEYKSYFHNLYLKEDLKRNA